VIATSVLPDKPTVISNGRVQRQIYVPSTRNGNSSNNNSNNRGQDTTDSTAPIIITSTDTNISNNSSPAPNGFTDVPAYEVQEHFCK
jgi:hypothetical protein